jgi:ring-1,2-phenylacetyl-CoA epoxidase subunit PaaE
MPPRFHSLSVQKIQRETPNSISITFAVPEHLQADYSFTQGQYLTLRTNIDGSEVRRSYSICSSPFENTLRVAVKQVENGLFSTYANTVLQVGDVLDVMTPVGNFFTPLSPQNQNQYIAFASGSGITPILSIIKQTLHAEPHSQFILFYGNKNYEQIMFREELINLKNAYLDRFALHHILSRESVGVPLLKGRLNGDKCAQFARSFFDPLAVEAYFLCGPEEMINEVTATLLGLGVNQKHVHYELFTAPNSSQFIAPKTSNAPSPTVDEFESMITVTLDGHTYDFSLYSESESILEAAHEYGVDLPYACKGGVCCTCKAKILEGAVKMDVNYALEPDEVAAGYVLTCQSHPLSKRVVLTFDEN